MVVIVGAALDVESDVVTEVAEVELEAFVEEELVELVLLVELSELVDLSAMLMFELEGATSDATTSSVKSDLEELEGVETSDATTSELEGVELIDVEADIVVTATRTTNSCPHIIKCMRALEQRKTYSLRCPEKPKIFF